MTNLKYCLGNFNSICNIVYTCMGKKRVKTMLNMNLKTMLKPNSHVASSILMLARTN